MFHEYMKKLEPRLKELDGEIEKVKVKAESSKAEFKELYEDQMGRILASRKQVRSKVAELREAGSEGYEEVRKDVERSIADLKKGIDKIVESIRKAA